MSRPDFRGEGCPICDGAAHDPLCPVFDRMNNEARRIRLLEAALKLIAFPELQSDYTPQQLARHALRIEPLSRAAKISTDVQ